MKRLICILITLPLIFVFASCSASKNPTADVSTSAAVTAPKMVEYKSELGPVSYPAEYEDDYVIKEINDKEKKGHVISFDADVDGKEMTLFSLVFTDKGDSQWTYTDKDGKKYYVTVDMFQINETDLTEEQLNKLYSMQEGVNDILDSLK